MHALATVVWQDAIVTALAVAAGVVIFRRVFGFFQSRPQASACEKCASSHNTCAPAEPAASAKTHPVTFIRSAR